MKKKKINSSPSGKKKNDKRKKSIKKKTYKTSRSERYHGNLTSYRFVIRHKNFSYSEGENEEKLEKFIRDNNNRLLKKVIASPIRKKFGKIKRVTSAIKGTAKIDVEKGSHKFPLWRASTEFTRTPIKTKAEFVTDYFMRTRDDVKQQLKDLFFENESNYYQDSSSKATTINIDESILYVETQPLQSHTAKTVAKKAAKRKKLKNSNLRHRNKSVDESKKTSNVRRRKSKSIRRRRKSNK